VRVSLVEQLEVLDGNNSSKSIALSQGQLTPWGQNLKRCSLFGVKVTGHGRRTTYASGGFAVFLTTWEWRRLRFTKRKSNSEHRLIKRMWTRKVNKWVGRREDYNQFDIDKVDFISICIWIKCDLTMWNIMVYIPSILFVNEFHTSHSQNGRLCYTESN